MQYASQVASGVIDGGNFHVSRCRDPIKNAIRAGEHLTHAR